MFKKVLAWSLAILISLVAIRVLFFLIGLALKATFLIVFLGAIAVLSVPLYMVIKRALLK